MFCRYFDQYFSFWVTKNDNFRGTCTLECCLWYNLKTFCIKEETLARHQLSSFISYSLYLLDYNSALGLFTYYVLEVLGPSGLGRGDFEKKSQKVPAFWKMGAVTVIRLSGYILIPPCTSLTCRCFSLGVENAKQH